MADQPAASPRGVSTGEPNRHKQLAARRAELLKSFTHDDGLFCSHAYGEIDGHPLSASVISPIPFAIVVYTLALLATPFATPVFVVVALVMGGLSAGPLGVAIALVVSPFLILLPWSLAGLLNEKIKNSARHRANRKLLQQAELMGHLPAVDSAAGTRADGGR